jgi:hypothetical protein
MNELRQLAKEPARTQMSPSFLSSGAVSKNGATAASSTAANTTNTPFSQPSAARSWVFHPPEAEKVKSRRMLVLFHQEA